MSQFDFYSIGKVARQKLLTEASHIKDQNLRRLVAHANLYDKFLLEVQSEPPPYIDVVSFSALERCSSSARLPRYTDPSPDHTETLPEYNSSVEDGHVSLNQQRKPREYVVREKIGDNELEEVEHCEHVEVAETESDVLIETGEIFDDD